MISWFFLWRTSPSPWGLQLPDQAAGDSDLMSPECVSPSATMIGSEPMGSFLSDWNERVCVHVCVCVCVFSAKRKYGTEEHAFSTHGLGLNPSCPVSLPSDQVALGESLIFPGSQSSPAKWGKNPPCLKGCYVNAWMFVKLVLMFVSSKLSCEHLRSNTFHRRSSFVVFLSSVNASPAFLLLKPKILEVVFDLSLCVFTL